MRLRVGESASRIRLVARRWDGVFILRFATITNSRERFIALMTNKVPKNLNALVPGTHHANTLASEHIEKVAHV